MINGKEILKRRDVIATADIVGNRKYGEFYLTEKYLIFFYRSLPKSMKDIGDVYKVRFGFKTADYKARSFVLPLKEIRVVEYTNPIPLVSYINLKLHLTDKGISIVKDFFNKSNELSKWAFSNLTPSKKNIYQTALKNIKSVRSEENVDDAKKLAKKINQLIEK